MTRYQNPKFSVGGYRSKAYDEGWERTFGKKLDDLPDCPTCNGKGYLVDAACEACSGTGKQVDEVDEKG